MDQAERLDSLIERFAADAQRRFSRAPRTEEEKRDALRSLMNIREPRPMDAETLALQDEYLADRARERGVTAAAELPTIREALGSARAQADSICLWQGDITLLSADAIVNAANSGMLGCFQPLHNCIDNCIHTFAGVQLRLECARQMDALSARLGEDYMQPTSVPMLTPGYNLPAAHVIHIVGPIVNGALREEHRRALTACYENTLDLCADNGLSTVAFCCISTGVFGYPKYAAAQVAVSTVERWLDAHPGAVERVIFNVHSDADRLRYEELLG